MDTGLKSSEKLRARPIILKNFIIDAKLFFLLSAANVLEKVLRIHLRISVSKNHFGTFQQNHMSPYVRNIVHQVR